MTFRKEKKIKGGLFIGVVLAVGLHIGFLLFGGSIFGDHDENQNHSRQVELFSENEEVQKDKEKEKDKQPPAEKVEEMDAEKPPDAADIIRNVELSEAAKAPALEAASLGAIEAALSGLTGTGGDFAEALSFSSGGRIGGMGKAGATEKNLEDAFSLSEIDQKPRPIFQAAPVYPSGMRSVEGLVTIVLVVNPSGKVTATRVEKSTHPEFEKPAMEAVKQWKFEPGVKGGQRVSCRMRVPIRFKPR